MKHSFRRQLMIIFSAVMAGTLILMFLCSALFLERYYIADKRKQVMSAYTKFNTAAREGMMDSEEFYESLQSFSMTDNISVAVMGTDGRLRVYSTRNSDQMRFQLWEFILGRESIEKTRILEENENYILRQTLESISGMEYLEMIGNLDNGDYFIMKTPLESIRDSVMIANRFYSVIGVLAIVVSGLIIYLFSRRVTKPIMELAEISKRMTALDFDAKFKSEGNIEAKNGVIR